MENQYQDIAAAILAVMQKVEKIHKSESKTVSYKFASKDVVIAAIRPALVEAGIVIVPIHVAADTEVFEDKKGNPAHKTTGSITYRLIHAATGSFIDAMIPSEAIDWGDKASNKFLGFAMKNVLLQSFILESGEEDPETTPSEEQTRGSAKKSSGKKTSAASTGRGISWSADVIQAIIETGAASSPPHAISLLNREDVIFPQDVIPEWSGVWGKAYQANRYVAETGEKVGTPAEAIAAANATLTDWIVKNVPANHIPKWIDSGLFDEESKIQTDADIPF